MKDNVFRSFLRDTYDGTSPIPFIITAQAAVFILIHIVELLSFSEITDQGLFFSVSALLSLPATFSAFITQPWSILTHTLIYQNILHILFDCIWLYWIGNLFLNFLAVRQFWTVFGVGLLGGALFYLLVGELVDFSGAQYWNSMSFGIAALISAAATLLPRYELRLVLFGNVKLLTIALVYLGVEVLFTGWTNPQVVLPLLLSIFLGWVFIRQLNLGRDWSKISRFSRGKKLKVVYRKETEEPGRSEWMEQPSQEQIDQILDKISQSGYDKLSSKEKEILFKASKQDQE